METVEYRLAIRERVIKFVQSADATPRCFFDGKFNSIKIGKKLGTGNNVQGDVYRGCTENTDNECMTDVAVKLIIPPEGVNELIVMDFLVQAFAQRCTPNIPLMFMWGTCPDCQFRRGVMFTNKADGRAVFRPPKLEMQDYVMYDGGVIECTTFLTEYAAYGDLEAWIDGHGPSDAMLENAFFQICAGLVALYTNYGLTHNDLHVGNVLVHRVQPGGCWEYFIMGQRYLCPNLGVLVVLWDFGFATVPGLVRLKPEYQNADGLYGDMRDGPLAAGDVARIIDSVTSLYVKKQLRKPKKGKSPSNKSPGRRTEYPDFIKKINKHKHETVHSVFDALFAAYRDDSAEPGASTCEGPIIETYFYSDVADVIATCNNALQQPALQKRLAPQLSDNMLRAIVVNQFLHPDTCIYLMKHIDWALVSRTLNNPAVGEMFPDKIDWRAASLSPHLTESLVAKHLAEVDLRRVARYAVLSPAFLAEHRDRLDWRTVTRHQDMSAAFMIQMKDVVAWGEVTDDLLKKWKPYEMHSVARLLPWHRLTLQHHSAEDCLQLVDYIDWKFVSLHRRMDDMKFISVFSKKLDARGLTLNASVNLYAVATTFAHLVDWDVAATADPRVLRRFAERVNWALVSRTIPAELMAEFGDFLVWDRVFDRDAPVAVPLGVVSRYIERIDLADASRTIYVADSTFYERYEQELDWAELFIGPPAAVPDRLVIRHFDEIDWTRHAGSMARLLDNIDVFVDAKCRVDWALVSRQPLAAEFVLQHHAKLDMREVSLRFGARDETDELYWDLREIVDFSVLRHYDAFEDATWVMLDRYLSWENVSKHVDLGWFSTRQMLAALFDRERLLHNVSFRGWFDWDFIRAYRDKISWQSVAEYELRDGRPTGRELPHAFKCEFLEYLEEYLDI